MEIITSSNTFPGVAQMSFFRQTILEHVAHELGKDPLVVTKLNMFGLNDVRNFCESVDRHCTAAGHMSDTNVIQYERCFLIPNFDEINKGGAVDLVIYI